MYKFTCMPIGPRIFTSGHLPLVPGHKDDDLPRRHFGPGSGTGALFGEPGFSDQLPKVSPDFHSGNHISMILCKHNYERARTSFRRGLPQ